MCHYVVAVATEEEYRRRGYMGELLRHAMREMYDRKEPFTFLMPAAEGIYTPYDFRFVYAQSRAEDFAACDALEPGICSDAALSDAEETAQFVQKHFTGKWQVYAVRDAQYYQTQIFEQQSENGGIRLMRPDGKLAGLFFYSDEDGLEIREPLYLEGYESLFRRAVSELMRLRGSSAKIYAWEGGEKRNP